MIFFPVTLIYPNIILITSLLSRLPLNLSNPTFLILKWQAYYGNFGESFLNIFFSNHELINKSQYKEIRTAPKSDLKNASQILVYLIQFTLFILVEEEENYSV